MPKKQTEQKEQTEQTPLIVKTERVYNNYKFLKTEWVKNKYYVFIK